MLLLHNLEGEFEFAVPSMVVLCDGGKRIFGASAVLIKAVMVLSNSEWNTKHKKNLVMRFDKQPQHIVYMLCLDRLAPCRPYVRAFKMKPEWKVNVEDFGIKRLFSAEHAET